MSRPVKSIPNAITSMNLLSGTIGVVFASFLGRVDVAFAFMLAAAVFDFCDGLAARLLGAYSDMGKELDSLSDLVSFGVLPSVMLLVLMASVNGLRWYCFIPLLLAVATGLRLAKFNVDPRQSHSFLGLPAPASAMIAGSFADFCWASPGSAMDSLVGSIWFIPVFTILLSALLVSEIPMFSLKFSKEDKGNFLVNAKRTALLTIAVLSVVAVAVAGVRWTVAVFAIFLVYLLMNLLFAVLPGKAA